MRVELIDALRRDFPSVFPGGRGAPSCGDGWEPLVRRLCEKLAPLGVEAVQVKEKFGTLHFYVTGGNDAAYELIAAAEDESMRTCEACGTGKGVTTSAGGGYWIMSLCAPCRTAWDKDRGRIIT